MDFLKEACNRKCKTTKIFKNIRPGRYLVHKFKLLETKFGMKVLVEIDNFEAFLPPRFTELIGKPEIIKELNEDQYILIYNGKSGRSYDIDFTKIDPEQNAEEMYDWPSEFLTQRTN